MLFLGVGVLLAGWTFQTKADSYTVNAKVAAPLPSGPAEIISPGNGQRFSEIPITVSGTCPANTYVKIYRNDFFSGSAICAVDGNFHLNIDLFPGANKLKAKVFNITDDEGPAGTPITVYYDAPIPPTAPPASGGPAPASSGSSSGSSTGGSSQSAVSVLTLTTNTKFTGYTVGQTVEWSVEISGGSPPYALNIDWGDGTSDIVSENKTGLVSFTHRYKSVGKGTKNTYTIKVTASDSQGNKAYLQNFIVVNSSSLPNLVASSLPPGPSISDKWLMVIWPAYAVLILMAISFFLGEREELIELKRRRFARRRRA
jgi:hypothetical protein